MAKAAGQSRALISRLHFFQLVRRVTFRLTDFLLLGRDITA